MKPFWNDELYKLQPAVSRVELWVVSLGVWSAWPSDLKNISSRNKQKHICRFECNKITVCTAKLPPGTAEAKTPHLINVSFLHMDDTWKVYLLIGSFSQTLLKNSVSAFWFSALNSNWIGLLSEGSTFWNGIFYILKLPTFNHWGTTHKEIVLKTFISDYLLLVLHFQFSILSPLQGGRQLPFLFDTVPPVPL